jgi:hypothetical protein
MTILVGLKVADYKGVFSTSSNNNNFILRAIMSLANKSREVPY